MKPESQLGEFFKQSVLDGEALRRLTLHHALNELDTAINTLPTEANASVIAAEIAGVRYRVDDNAGGLFSAGAPKDIRTTKPYDIMAHPTDPSTIIASRLTRFSIAGSGRAPIDMLMSGKSEGASTVMPTYYLFAIQADGSQAHMASGEKPSQQPDTAPDKPHIFDEKRFAPHPAREDHHFGIVRRGSDILAFTLKPNPRLGQVVPIVGGGSDSISDELNKVGPLDRKHTMIEPIKLSGELVADIIREVELIKELHKKEKPQKALGRLRGLVMRKSAEKPA